MSLFYISSKFVLRLFYIFTIKQNELKGLIEKYSVNEALVSEIQRLKEENNRLKSKYWMEFPNTLSW